MNRLDLFENVHKTAMSNINLLLEEDNELSVLLKWMLETEIDLSSYLPDSFTGALNSSLDFVNLGFLIKHALYDDGEITFVKNSYGHPYIIFINQQNIPEDYEVIGNSTEFIKVCEDYHLNELKKHFIRDCAIHGVEFTVKEYSSNPLFNSQWPISLKKEIDEKIDFYSFQIYDSEHSISLKKDSDKIID